MQHTALMHTTARNLQCQPLCIQCDLCTPRCLAAHTTVITESTRACSPAGSLLSTCCARIVQKHHAWATTSQHLPTWIRCSAFTGGNASTGVGMTAQSDEVRTHTKISSHPVRPAELHSIQALQQGRKGQWSNALGPQESGL
jgi:hypothetical protein